ncbi:hypothetical protein D3C87_1203260 [compost metagenome]
MAHSAKVVLQTSVQRPATTTFLRPLAARASRTFWSSQEFIDVRSSVFWFGNTSSTSGYVKPENDSLSTVVMVVGTLKILAALARPTTLFFSAWRSIDWTPKAICGWWSMMMSWLFCGVRTSSFGLDMMVLQENIGG